jgi:hypothetical protein
MTQRPIYKHISFIILAQLDRWCDSMVWGLLESEYLTSPAAKVEVKVFGASGERVA